MDSNKIIGACTICGNEIDVQMCCNGYECGCMGMPVDPPVCSNECYDSYMNEIDKRDSINQSGFLPYKNKGDVKD